MKILSRCALCKSKNIVKIEDKITRKVAGRRFNASVPAERCDDCSEVYYSSSEVEWFERTIAQDLGEHGPINGESFRFMRKIVGVQAKELATLLGVTPETVSRWENGSREVDRPSWVLVAAMVRDLVEGTQSTLTRVRLLCHAKPKARTILPAHEPGDLKAFRAKVKHA